MGNNNIYTGKRTWTADTIHTSTEHRRSDNQRNIFRYIYNAY